MNGFDVILLLDAVLMLQVQTWLTVFYLNMENPINANQYGSPFVMNQIKILI